jgi:hypothetical protein
MSPLSLLSSDRFRCRAHLDDLMSYRTLRHGLKAPSWGSQVRFGVRRCAGGRLAIAGRRCQSQARWRGSFAEQALCDNSTRAPTAIRLKGCDTVPAHGDNLTDQT